MTEVVALSMVKKRWSVSRGWTQVVTANPFPQDIHPGRHITLSGNNPTALIKNKYNTLFVRSGHNVRVHQISQKLILIFTFI